MNTGRDEYVFFFLQLRDSAVPWSSSLYNRKLYHVRARSRPMANGNTTAAHPVGRRDRFFIYYFFPVSLIRKNRFSPIDKKKMVRAEQKKKKKTDRYMYIFFFSAWDLNAVGNTFLMYFCRVIFIFFFSSPVFLIYVGAIVAYKVYVRKIPSTSNVYASARSQKPINFFFTFCF